MRISMNPYKYPCAVFPMHRFKWHMFNESELLSSLSPALVREIQLFKVRTFIQTSPIFREMSEVPVFYVGCSENFVHMRDSLSSTPVLLA